MFPSFVLQYLPVTVQSGRCLLDELVWRLTAVDIAYCTLLECIRFRSAQMSVLRRVRQQADSQIRIAIHLTVGLTRNNYVNLDCRLTAFQTGQW